MTSDDLSLMVKYSVQFEHFDRLEVVDLKKFTFFLLSLLFLLHLLVSVSIVMLQT